MRKILLGTTAILGAFALSHAAEAQSSAPLTVTLGGSFNFHGGLIREDLDQNVRNHAFDVDSSVIVGAEGKAGNGLIYGAHLELLSDSNDEDALDELYGYVSGEFGQVEFGHVGGAVRRLHVAAPADFATGGAIGGQWSDFVSTSFGGGEFFYSGIDSVSGIYTLFRPFDSHDAAKVSYYSPRFAGLQFGASFTPDGENGSGILQRGDGNANASANSQGLANRGNFENFWELGANYAHNVNGFDVGAAVTYIAASSKSTAHEDLSSWNAGLSLGYAGFTLGGGYTYAGDSGYLKNQANDDSGRGWNVGLQYEAGPFVVGANALWAKNEGNQAVARDNKLRAYSLGTTYKLAPGLATYVEATVFEYDAADSNGVSRTNDGSVILVGTAVNF